MVKKEDNKNMNNNNNDLNKGKKDRKSIWSYILLVLIAILIVFTINNVFRWLKYKDTEVPVSDLVNKFLDWKYSEVLIEPSKAIATLSWQTVEENWAKRQLRDTANIPKNATHLDLWLVWVKSTVVKYSPTQNTEFWSSLITNIIFFVLILILGLLFIGKMWWMANSAMTFWKSRARLYDPTKDKITFKDVAWADDEKEELQEVVQFLKNPKKFKELWAKIPKWVLLVGPPWTWKTMLARAVAWESWVPFLSISGSEFVEMFVWVWASRVRDLFWNAKKIAPAIIFIDEIENGIHDLLIYEVISALSDSLNYIDNVQFITTTHSTYLMEELPPENIYVLAGDAYGKKEILSIDNFNFRTQKNNNIRLKYLRGNYSGIPNIGYIDFSELVEQVKEDLE